MAGPIETWYRPIAGRFRRFARLSAAAPGIPAPETAARRSLHPADSGISHWQRGRYRGNHSHPEGHPPAVSEFVYLPIDFSRNTRGTGGAGADSPRRSGGFTDGLLPIGHRDLGGA